MELLSSMLKGRSGLTPASETKVKVQTTPPPVHPTVLSSSGPFPPEIWIRVLTHLRKPIPSPNSRPRRSDLHQHELTITARVCKLWNGISNTLLYKNVLTDRFALFITNARSSSRNVINLTEKIYVEYSEEPTSISYDSILRYGKTAAVWDMVDPMSKGDMSQTGMLEDLIGVQTLSAGLQMLRGGCITDVFPKLETVAISSVYGRESERWMKFRREEQYLPIGHFRWTDVDACGKIWAPYLAQSRVRHICLRDGGGGPLAGHSTSHPNPFGSADGLVPGLTIHFDNFVDKFDFRSGAKTTWVSETPPSHHWAGTYRDLSGTLEQIEGRRAHIHQGDHPDSYAASLDIYSPNAKVEFPTTRTEEAEFLRKLAKDIPGDFGGSSRKDLTVEAQRAIAAKLGPHHQKSLRKHSGLNHSVRWHASADTPICPACGSAPP